MKILEYNDLDYSRVRRQYEKITACLEKGDFRSADVRKLQEHGLYRAKLDDANRLIFKIVTYKGIRYALMLEVILNHAYERSKFLRGVKIDEAKIPGVEDTAQIKRKRCPLLSTLIHLTIIFIFWTRLFPLTLNNRMSIRFSRRLLL